MHKKTIILSIILAIATILFLILSIITVNKIIYNYKCAEGYIEFTESNSQQTFSINKITYFSNCNADISTNSNSSFTIQNLYQYTDIAIFINNNLELNNNEYTPQNTLKSVYLSDINFSLEPSYGTPSLYYKNINDFANSTFDENHKIDDNITFEATSDNEIDYSEPVLYNNCANPITLCYVNSNIKDSYTLTNDVANISHNGSLLKTCGITLNSIACQISFNIQITNNANENFVCPVTLNIPLSTEDSTIYSGSLTLKDSCDYQFIKK